jgi:hypothetical protein
VEIGNLVSDLSLTQERLCAAVKPEFGAASVVIPPVVLAGRPTRGGWAAPRRCEYEVPVLGAWHPVLAGHETLRGDNFGMHEPRRLPAGCQVISNSSRSTPCRAECSESQMRNSRARVTAHHPAQLRDTIATRGRGHLNLRALAAIRQRPLGVLSLLMVAPLSLSFALIGTGVPLVVMERAVIGFGLVGQPHLDDLDW